MDSLIVIKPGNTPLTYDSAKSSGGSPSGGGSKPGAGASSGSGLDINNPNGGFVSIDEKKEILDISCEQKLVNPDAETNLFGPDYPTKNVNYLRILVRCPSNCFKNKGEVYGYGIHPQNSPICLSAIVDNAMSLYGGIVSVSIFPAFTQYSLTPDTPKEKHNIQILPYDKGGVKKSYILARIDNVDIVEKDIRILNNSEGLDN